MNLTSGGEHRPLLSMYVNDYTIKRKAPLAPLKKKKRSKSFMWPALLLLYGKPQDLKAGRTSAAQSPAFTLWFTRNAEGPPVKSKQSQPTQSWSVIRTGQYVQHSFPATNSFPFPLVIHFSSNEDLEVFKTNLTINIIDLKIRHV